MNRDQLRQIITLVALVGSVAAANFFGLAGENNTGEVANQFADRNYFFPAGYVFGTIWTVIYAGVIAYAIYQALPGQRENDRFRAAVPWFIVNMLLNAFWTYIFGLEQYVLSLVVIIVIVFTGIMTYRALRIGRVTDVTTVERVTWVTIGIYIAWLCVATVANVTIVWITQGWSTFGISDPIWGAIMLAVGGALGLFLSWALRDLVIYGVFVYAYIGVIVRLQRCAGRADNRGDRRHCAVGCVRIRLRPSVIAGRPFDRQSPPEQAA